MAQNGLATLVQEDFSGGAFPGYSRDSIPQNGVEDAVNCLITDDGQLAHRGGATYKSNATFGSGLRLLWDGYLAAGLRTVFANTADWGVLDSDDTTPLNLGGSGMSVLNKPAASGGMLFLPGGTIYGGSRLTTSLSVTGEVITAANGSPTVTTANPPTTAWTSANIQPGTLFRATSGLGDKRYYVVKSLDSNHQITLTSPYQGASFVDFVNFEFVQLGTHSRPSSIYFAAANKLVALIDDKAYMSPIGDPTTMNATEYHQFPAGASTLGGEALRDTGIVFTTEGVFAISNLALDLTDAQGNPQQRLDQVSRDLILWSWPGVAQWGNALIVPAVDGVWLLDGISAPRRITGGMEKLYRSYVDAGYQTGYATVFNNEYFLPILDGSFGFADALVCRLTPTRRGTAFGWSRFDGDGAKVVGYANRVATTAARQPYMMGGHLTNGRVLKTSYFNPAVTTDADATASQSTIVSRELTGDISTLAKKIRIRYELTDPAAANPTLTAEWAQGDGSYTTLAGAAAENDDPTTSTWNVNKRNPHFRLKTTGATSNFTLHSMTILVRPSGRQ